MAMDGSDEALLSDLHFLIATDEQVQDDFSYLCDLLDESMSDPFDGGPANVDDTSESGGGCNADLNLQKMMPPLVTDVAEKPASTKRKAGVKDTFPDTGARNRFQYRQRQELKALKMQVEQLQAKLAAETLKSSTRLIRAGDISPWEQAARKELFERNRALAENKQLKEALDEHLTFVDHMQNLFKKKPRLLAKNPSSEEWQAYKLAAQHSLRVAAIHAIADRQFQRMQSAFIQAGLFNTTSDKPVVSGSPRVLPDGQILIELRRQFTLPVPYSVVGTACWNVMKTRMDECGPTETMETIDAHTVYHKSAQCVAGVIVHSNSIRRYYAGTNRDVVVWRTVLEDALVPHMSRGSVNNECGW
ncbi:hypothetical protein, variant 1 [Aphanomyces invadans]|nr:hypothetical protein, variant 1 [Aphanomyces invadans]ETW05248.1 hypothetical protein, variant 1 [Aphanomyces invadans]|eukprot:XP_008866685.1 hypothetical protein, variant 1 [Aphanomyces invadans]